MKKTGKLDMTGLFLYKHADVKRILIGAEMFILANFLNAVAYILEFSINIYMYLIIARAIISWVNPDPYNPVVRFLYSSTDPVLNRVRRFMPDLGGLDISPIIVILLIIFLQKFVVNSIFELVNRMKFGIGVLP